MPCVDSGGGRRFPSFEFVPLHAYLRLVAPDGFWVCSVRTPVGVRRSPCRICSSACLDAAGCDGWLWGLFLSDPGGGASCSPLGAFSWEINPPLRENLFPSEFGSSPSDFPLNLSLLREFSRSPPFFPFCLRILSVPPNTLPKIYEKRGSANQHPFRTTLKWNLPKKNKGLPTNIHVARKLSLFPGTRAGP